MRSVVTILVVCISLPLVSTQNSTEPALMPQKNEENTTTEPANELIGKELQPFSQLAHGLRSGPITIIDDKTFFIGDLYYDGNGPDAHFWAGVGPKPLSNGTLVPNENGSRETLSAYTGQNVTITLPEPLTVQQIDYLGVWCIKFQQNFGSTTIPRKVERIFNAKPLGVQLPPFSQLAHGLRSGPIVIVDKQTFFIPNLHYDGKGPDAHFWVGNGSSPSPDGILVPDEKNLRGSISAYTGQNVYIKLPNGVTVDNIDYFGVWCIEFKHNFGHVNIPRKLEVPEANGDSRITVNKERIVPIQKCCPLNEVLTTSGCKEKNVPFEPLLKFHIHNSTHVDDVPVPAQAIKFETFVNFMKCNHDRFPLYPEDRYALLENGSLIYLDAHKIFSLDNYCIETNEDEGETDSVWQTTPIICSDSLEDSPSYTVFIIYAVGVIVSAVFLIITALVFLLVEEVRDTRGKCVVLYSLSMAAAFICLASAQLSGIDDDTCKVLGFIIQFFLVLSFTWLTMISWETYYKIRHYSDDAYSRDRKRLCIYLGLGIFIPVLVAIISTIIDNMPGVPGTFFKPHFGKNTCWFDQKKGTLLFFYIPVAFAILCNIVLACLMKWNLVWFQRNRSLEFTWLAMKQDLKPMFRSCTFLLSVMTLCWSVEIISFAVKGKGGVWTAIDIISSLQGLFVFIIFVLHRPVKDKICNIRGEQMDRNQSEDKPMTLLNMNGNANANHSNHNDFS